MQTFPTDYEYPDYPEILPQILPLAKYLSLEKNRDEMTSEGQNKFLHSETERLLYKSIPQMAVSIILMPFYLTEENSSENTWGKSVTKWG